MVLLITAITISFLHTITGPDHYLPFVMLGKSRGWSPARTVGWTMICGCGHVWSSVLLGLGGAAIGWSVSSLQSVQSVRGGIAGWSLVVFGLLYSIWGVIRANRNSLHKHFDIHDDGSIYVYEHRDGYSVAAKEKHRVTPWVMFIIFLLGPCEPMIPLLYFPAVNGSWVSMFLLVMVYTIFTISTMAAMVLFGYYGLSLLRTNLLNRYMHAVAGISIFICGLGMVWLGW
jgi:sulfite exporter TauE/SafE